MMTVEPTKDAVRQSLNRLRNATDVATARAVLGRYALTIASLKPDDYSRVIEAAELTLSQRKNE